MTTIFIVKVVFIVDQNLVETQVTHRLSECGGGDEQGSQQDQIFGK
jgi:hypothetical protein